MKLRMSNEYFIVTIHTIRIRQEAEKLFPDDRTARIKWKHDRVQEARAALKAAGLRPEYRIPLSQEKRRDDTVKRFEEVLTPPYVHSSKAFSLLF